MRQKRTPQQNIDAVLATLMSRNTTIAIHIEALASMSGIGRLAAREAVDALIGDGVVERVERRAAGLMVRSIAYAYRLRSADESERSRDRDVGP